MAKLNLSRKKIGGRKTKRAFKLIKGGKCGCSSSFFTGGNSGNIPYPLGMVDNDPRNTLLSTRIQPNMTGGKNTKRRGSVSNKRRKHKKMKGGSTSVLLGTDLSLRNPISAGLSLQGAISGSNIMSGNLFSNSHTYNTPNHVNNVIA